MADRLDQAADRVAKVRTRYQQPGNNSQVQPTPADVELLAVLDMLILEIRDIRRQLPKPPRGGQPIA